MHERWNKMTIYLIISSSSNDQSIFETVTEQQMSSMDEVARRFTSFYDHIRLSSSDYLWYLTIIVSILTLILILSIILESKSFPCDSAYSHYLFFQSTTSFFLHCLFNCSYFSQTLTHAFNEHLRHRKVSKSH
jgi:hypothetical protein